MDDSDVFDERGEVVLRTDDVPFGGEEDDGARCEEFL